MKVGPENSNSQITAVIALHNSRTPSRLATPVKKFKLAEVGSAIKQVRSRKAPGYDLITGRM